MKERTKSDTPRNSPRRLVVNRGGVAEFARQEPICKNAASCGSCPYLDTPYRDQLAEKTRYIESLASRRTEALGPVTVRPCAASPRTIGYRCTAKLVVGDSLGAQGKRWIHIGLYRPRTHEVVDVGRCPIHAEAVNDLLAALRTEIWKAELPIYNPRTRKGLLRYVVVRAAHTGSDVVPQCQLTLVTSDEKHTGLKAFAREIAGRFPALQGIVQHVNTTQGNAIFHMADEAHEGGESTLLTGTDTLTDTFCGLNLRFSATSFMQVNPWTAEKLYFRMDELAGLSSHETLLDLYCGVGAITLLLGKRAGRAIGIEETPSSIADARYNAERNAIPNTEFHAGRAEDVLPELLRQGKLTHADVVTLNPSRRGCQPEVLKAVAALTPRTVLYMSCDPKTLLRDLEVLHGEGYRTLFLEPFDMFPGTHHCEVVACLQRG